MQPLLQNLTSTILTDDGKNTYHLARDVYLFTEDGLTQILDFHDGQFYGLDPIASLMLSLVLEKGFEETIKHIIINYDASEVQVRNDLIQLLQKLEQDKLLITSEQNNNSSSLPPLHLVLPWLLQHLGWIFRKVFNLYPNPDRFTVDLLLSLSWLSFRCLGWSRTLQFWMNLTPHPPSLQGKGETDNTPLLVGEGLGERSSNSSKIIQMVDTLVRETATSKLFLPMVCKERALVGYHLLRVFYGLPAVLIIGINRYPFQVHAWVECDGLIVTDDIEHCETFTPVVQYPCISEQ